MGFYNTYVEEATRASSEYDRHETVYRKFYDLIIKLWALR